VHNAAHTKITGWQKVPKFVSLRQGTRDHTTPMFTNVAAVIAGVSAAVSLVMEISRSGQAVTTSVLPSFDLIYCVYSY
jgi:hypothetical protein